MRPSPELTNEASWATQGADLVLRDAMFGNRRHFRELLAGSEEGILALPCPARPEPAAGERAGA